MIDKADIAAGVIALASAVVAQVTDTMADIPGVGQIANLSAVGAMIYLVLWTIPKLTKDFRDEMKEERDFHRDQLDKLREEFKCQAVARTK